MAYYDSVASAVGDALAFVRQHSRLRLWYGAQEFQTEFSDWRTVARMFADGDETWAVVEEVVVGRLTRDDPKAVEAMARNTLIATAIAHVLA
jgi:hypothetical protein